MYRGIRLRLPGDDTRGWREREGMSIIDVLALVLIICIAVAMLLPGLTHRGESAHKTVCKNNLKNIGLCAKMYAQDYNDEWPAFHSGRSPAEARDADDLSILFDTYLTDEELLECPKAETEVEAAIDHSLNLRIVLGNSYTYTGGGPVDDESMSVKWVAGDLWNEGAGPGERSRVRPWRNVTLPASNHEGGINALFGDGHVRWIKATGTRILYPCDGGTDDGGGDDLHIAGEKAWSEGKDAVLYASDGSID